MSAHESECGDRAEDCGRCGEVVLLRDWDAHLSYVHGVTIVQRSPHRQRKKKEEQQQIRQQQQQQQQLQAGERQLQQGRMEDARLGPVLSLSFRLKKIDSTHEKAFLTVSTLFDTALCYVIQLCFVLLFIPD